MTPAEIQAHTWLGLEAQAHQRTMQELAAEREKNRLLQARLEALEAQCHPQETS